MTWREVSVNFSSNDVKQGNGKTDKFNLAQ